MTYAQLKRHESSEAAILRQYPEWVRLRERAEGMNATIRRLAGEGRTAAAFRVAQSKLEISRKADLLARGILAMRQAV